MRSYSFFKRNVVETCKLAKHFNCPERQKICTEILEDSTVDILYPIRRPMQCPILLPRVTSASSPTGLVLVSSLQGFVDPVPAQPSNLRLHTEPQMCCTTTLILTLSYSPVLLWIVFISKHYKTGGRSIPTMRPLLFSFLSNNIKVPEFTLATEHK